MLPSILLLAVLSADGGVDAGTPLGPCSTKQTICFSPLGACDKKLVALFDECVCFWRSRLRERGSLYPEVGQRLVLP